MRRLPALVLANLIVWPIVGSGQETGVVIPKESATIALPEFILVEQRVANDEPVVTFAMPVTLLRYEPQVDLQTRNFGEAQGDITIRGGIFENSGIQVGGWSLFDPQTGHYLAEIPISPRMLDGARVLTGIDHAAAGFNATVGTVRYGWAPIRTGGFVEAGYGSHNLIRCVAYGAIDSLVDRSDWKVGADLEVAYSQSDGALPDGDHEFTRYAGRIQSRGEVFQTDIVASYQHKFFGWPNLYTPFGVAETDDLETTLVGFSHRVETGAHSWVRFGGYYRDNRDDYEFDRYRPGIFNPYEHETKVTGLDLEGRFQLRDWEMGWRAEMLSDQLESTALTYGPFMSRSYVKGSVTGSRTWGDPVGTETGLTLGLTAEDTNRDGGFVGPLLEIWRSGAWGDGRWRLGGQVTGTSQVPGYTAIGSNPDGGLFRGNPDLVREESLQAEINGEWRSGSRSIEASLFYRDDDPLVDWTYTASSSNARKANPVAIETVGVEVIATQQWESVDLILGYTWLDKYADYLGATVDASFYALNHARHRITAALVWRIGREFEVRSDNEWRIQEPNALRTIGGDNALLSSLSLHYSPQRWDGLRLILAVDNLWDSEFQELPAVPAAPRQWSGSVSWSW
ncbi:MAG: TonB-dependent receptor [Opitutaceae bacterium]